MVTSVEKMWRNLSDGVDTTVTSSLTTLGDDIEVSELERVSFQLLNTGVLLDQFSILGNHTKEGTMETLYNTAGDFNSPAGLLVATSGDLTAIAHGSTGWFMMDCRGLFAIRIRAASSGGDTVVTLNGGGS